MAIERLRGGETEPDFRNRVGQVIDELNRLSNGGAATGPLELKSYTVATAPADPEDGRVIFVSDGDGGDPCLAVSVNGDWLRLSLGAAIAENDE